MSLKGLRKRGLRLRQQDNLRVGNVRTKVRPGQKNVTNMRGFSASGVGKRARDEKRTPVKAL